MRIQKKYNRASLTLTTVLFVSAILLTAGISIVVTSVDNTANTKTYSNAQIAALRAKNCLEESLYRVNKSTAYTGNFSISFSDGSCTATIANGSANQKTVNINAVVDIYNYSTSKIIDYSTSPFQIIN